LKVKNKDHCYNHFVKQTCSLNVKLAAYMIYDQVAMEIFQQRANPYDMGKDSTCAYFVDGTLKNSTIPAVLSRLIR